MKNEKERDRITPSAPISERIFYWGTCLALILVIIGAVGMISPAMQFPNFSWTNKKDSKKEEKLHRKPACKNGEMKMYSSAHSYIEQAITGKSCYSGLVVLPPDANIEGYAPGKTRIYECKDENPRSCFYKFTVSDLKGGYYKNAPMFPRRFRMKGEPGVAWFGKKPEMSLGKETLAQEVARVHQEIEEMEIEKKLLKERKKVKKRKSKLEKKLAKMRKK